MSTATPRADWPREAVDDIAEVVAAVPGVAALTAGPFDDLATHLPGRRVIGVRRRQGLSEVAVVLHWGADALTVAEQIRARVGAVVPDPVDVTVADVTDPDLTGAEPSAPDLSYPDLSDPDLGGPAAATGGGLR